MTSTHFLPQALEEAPQPVEMDERLDRHLRVHINDEGGDFDIETPSDPWSRTHPQSSAHTEVPKLTRREAKRRYRASKAAQRQLEVERIESRRRMIDASAAPDMAPTDGATPASPIALIDPTPSADTHEPGAQPTTFTDLTPPTHTHDPEPPPAPPQPTPAAVLDPEPPAAPPQPTPSANTNQPPPAPPQPTIAAARRPARDGRSAQMVKAVAFLALLGLTSMLWYFSLGTLVVSRGTALVSGWDVTSILTGSMSPALNVGDLVAFEPVDAADLEVGQILVFDDPTRPEFTLVHRLEGINGDGTYTTKGDANEKADSTPVPEANLQGVVRMVSPYGGYPTMLLSHGKYPQLAVLIALLLGSALIVHGPEPRFMPRKHDPEPEPSADPETLGAGTLRAA